jgi:hypothetical protein
MGTIIDLGLAPPHDPMFGISSSNIVSHLVRRHINWNNLRPDLKEDLAHLVQDIRRRGCGIAIAVSPSF